MVHASPLKTNSPNPRQCTQPPRPILPPAVSASFRQPGAAPPAQNAWATLKPAHALQFAHSLSHYSVRRTRTHFLDRPLSHIYYSILREFFENSDGIRSQVPFGNNFKLNIVGREIFVQCPRHAATAIPCAVGPWSAAAAWRCVHGFDAFKSVTIWIWWIKTEINSLLQFSNNVKCFSLEKITLWVVEKCCFLMDGVKDDCTKSASGCHTENGEKLSNSWVDGQTWLCMAAA